MKAPCKDCAERQIGCHSACDKYREWKVGHDSKREFVSQKWLEANDYYNYKVNQIIKTKKKGR